MIWPLHLTVVSIVVLCGFVGRRLAQKFTIGGGWQGTRICPQEAASGSWPVSFFERACILC